MSKQYNIRWRKDDSEALSKAVRNFNAKIDRLAKKNPQEASALPEKVSVRQMKELIDTRQDLNRELNALRRFSKRGSEKLVDVPDSEYNLKITKWQKNEMTRRVGIINRKRAKRLEEIEGMEVTSRGEGLGYTRGQLGMGRAEEAQLQPMRPFTAKMTRHDLKMKARAINLQSQSNYFNKKDEQFRRTYIETLRQNYNEEDIKDVIETIENMDFKQFYHKFQSEGGTFEFAYPGDDAQYQGYVNALKSTWTPNKPKE
jgi:hypothetical protein